jgi:hypothetical protein
MGQGREKSRWSGDDLWLAGEVLDELASCYDVVAYTLNQLVNKDEVIQKIERSQLIGLASIVTDNTETLGSVTADVKAIASQMIEGEKP